VIPGGIELFQGLSKKPSLRRSAIPHAEVLHQQLVQCYLPDVPVRLCFEGNPDFPARAIQLKPEDVLGKDIVSDAKIALSLGT